MASSPLRWVIDLLRRAISCGANAIFALLLTATVASAQTPAADGQDTGNGASVPVLTVDMQRIKRESSAGKSVTAQSDNLRALIEAEIGRRETGLRSEETVLADIKDELNSQDFNARVDAFQEKVFATRQFAQAESAQLQAALRDASSALTAAITPVLAQIMRERGAGVMLDSSQIVLSLDALDATDEAIRRLDLIKPEIPLRYQGPTPIGDAEASQK